MSAQNQKGTKTGYARDALEFLPLDVLLKEELSHTQPETHQGLKGGEMGSRYKAYLKDPTSVSEADRLFFQIRERVRSGQSIGELQEKARELRFQDGNTFQALAIFLEALNHPDASVRGFVTGRIPAHLPGSVWGKALRDEDQEVRLMTACQIPADASPPLRTKSYMEIKVALEDEEDLVHQTMAVSRIPAHAPKILRKKAYQLIADKLDGKQTITSRLTAAGNIPSHAPESLWRTALKDKSLHVRIYAACNLPKDASIPLVSLAIPTLKKALKEKDSPPLRRFVASNIPQSASEKIWNIALCDKDDEVRLVAASKIPPTAPQNLLERAHDVFHTALGQAKNQWDLLQVARRVPAHFDPSFQEEVQKIMARSMNDPDELVRRAAAVYWLQRSGNTLERIQPILSTAPPNRLPVGLALTASLVSSQTLSRRSYDSIRRHLEAVRSSNSSQTDLAKKIDYNSSFTVLEEAMARLDGINPRAEELFFKKRKGNLPHLLADSTRIRQLDPSFIPIISQAVEQYGLSDKIDPILRLVRYGVAYGKLGLTPTEFKDALPQGNEFDLAGPADGILTRFSDEIGINVELEGNDKQVAVEEWDMESMSLLTSASKKWGGRGRKLFQTMVKAILEGKFEHMLERGNQPGTSQYFSGYDAQAQGLIESVWDYNAGVKKRAEELGVNWDVWRHPSRYIKSIVGDVRISDPLTYASLVQGVKKQYVAFITWVGANPQYQDEFERVNRKLGAIHEVLAAPSDTVTSPDNVSIQRLAPLGQLLEKICRRAKEKVPEEVGDLRNSLRTLSDQSTAQRLQSHPISSFNFWQRHPPIEMFFGTKATSCAGLDLDPYSFLEFLLDLGTHHVVTCHPITREVDGYARIFLAEHEGKPAVPVDVMRGLTALQHSRDLMGYITDYAGLCSVSPDGVGEGDIPLDAKVGGTLTDQYLQHTDSLQDIPAQIKLS